MVQDEGRLLLNIYIRPVDAVVSGFRPVLIDWAVASLNQDAQATFVNTLVLHPGGKEYLPFAALAMAFPPRGLSGPWAISGSWWRNSAHGPAEKKMDPVAAPVPPSSEPALFRRGQ